jgi:hypothetical protein
MIVTTPSGARAIAVRNGGPSIRSGSSSAGAKGGGLVEPSDEHREVDLGLHQHLAVLANQRLGPLLGVGIEVLERARACRVRSVALLSAAHAGQAFCAASTASRACSRLAAAAWPATEPSMRVVYGEGVRRGRSSPPISSFVLAAVVSLTAIPEPPFISPRRSAPAWAIA